MTTDDEAPGYGAFRPQLIVSLLNRHPRIGSDAVRKSLRDAAATAATVHDEQGEWAVVRCATVHPFLVAEQKRQESEGDPC